jgi:hypothetical protein
VPVQRALPILVGVLLGLSLGLGALLVIVMTRDPGPVESDPPIEREVASVPSTPVRPRTESFTESRENVIVRATRQVSPVVVRHQHRAGGRTTHLTGRTARLPAARFRVATSAWAAASSSTIAATCSPPVMSSSGAKH